VRVCLIVGGCGQGDQLLRGLIGQLEILFVDSESEHLVCTCRAVVAILLIGFAEAVDRKRAAVCLQRECLLVGLLSTRV
jgi:hypothetical protein